MSGPFRSDNIPEPRWIQGDPKAFAPEPPDNHLPDESRQSLLYIVEVLESTIDEVKGSYDSVDGEIPEVVEKAWKAWVEATNQLADKVDYFREDTVGDDWRHEI